jgi:hypothetical protein
LTAAVYLVPTGGERFELYTEPGDEISISHRPAREGFWHRSIHRLRERWRHAVHTARAERGLGASGRIARARDWVVCRIDDHHPPGTVASRQPQE